MTPAELRESLVLRRDHSAISNEAALRREIAIGRLRKITTGVFAPTEVWDRIDADERYRLLVHAASLRYPDAVFTHRSAAALWRLPVIGNWPHLAEATVETASGGRSRKGLIRYAIGIPEVEVRDGVSVSGLARTVVDSATVSPMAAGVAFADRALRTVTRGELETALGETAHGRGSARAKRVVGFADALSESPGESLSRVTMAMLGFEPPVLQQPFFDDSGFVGRVDFFWPGDSVVGEFDGHGKYLRKALRRGKTAAQVVVEEKQREDRLRRIVRRVVRWEWADALSPRRLEGLLGAAEVQRHRNR